MTPHPKAQGIFSKLRNLLLGKNADEDKYAVATIRELMGMESPVQYPNMRDCGHDDCSNHNGVTLLGNFSDTDSFALNKILPEFNYQERARIIVEMQGDDVGRRIKLLSAVTDLGNTGIFTTSIFDNLVSGLPYGVKAKERPLLVDQTRVRFGIMMNLAAMQGAYREPIELLYKRNADRDRVVLRDPSLDSAIVRNPEHLNRFVEMLISDPSMTGNRMAAVIRAEALNSTSHVVNKAP